MNKIFPFILLIALSFRLSAQIRIKAVGDIMMGSRTPDPIIPSNQGQVFVDSIASYLDSADFTFGNLEGVFVNPEIDPQKCSPRSRKAGKCYEFGMPENLATRLSELHFDILSMDNNHNSDYGWAGVENTKKILKGLGIHYASKKSPTSMTYTFSNTEKEKIVDTVKIDNGISISECTVTRIIEKDQSVAFIAFGHSSASYHVKDVELASKLVKELDKKNDLVIVSFHGGAEGTSAQNVTRETEKFYGEDRGNVYAFSHAVIDAGADMVIGHGPHVLRALELYKGKLICYSLGNFLTYGNVSLSGVKGIGAIIDVEIDEISGEFLSGKIIPIKQVSRGVPSFDPNGQAISVMRKLTAEDFPNGVLKIDENGILTK